MGKRKVKFQSVKVKFPEKLYLITNWFKFDNGGLWVFPHTRVYKNLKLGIKKAKIIYKDINKKEKSVLEHIMINPLTIMEKVFLKKEYWDNPNVEYDPNRRIHEFIKVYLEPQDYKVLVTPFKAQKKIFTAPIPFLKSSTNSDLEIFMQTSDWVVDPFADSCAYYSIGQTQSINIITKQFYNKDFKSNSLKTRQRPN